jgi:hypothetical protein
LWGSGGSTCVSHGTVHYQKEMKMSQSTCKFVTVDVYISRLDFVLGVSVQPQKSNYDWKVQKIKKIFFCSQCSVLESLKFPCTAPVNTVEKQKLGSSKLATVLSRVLPLLTTTYLHIYCVSTYHGATMYLLHIY